MFKSLQIDPETSAIHVNEQAVLRHGDGQNLLGLIERVFDDTPQSLIKFLRSEPDAALQARLAVFASNLLHELRHYADLVFTPYGFYRLRVAFEFYGAIVPLLTDDNNRELPIPIISGADQINQQLIGLRTYANSPIKRFSDIALTRMHIISQDNQKFRLSNDEVFTLGGDAILEALAYNTQSDWLVNLFNTPECRDRYPHFFGDYSGTPFDIKYRWYAPMMKALDKNYSLSTARMTQCILFASLCGAFGNRAKYFREDQFDAITTRYVDECLPSNRLDRLFLYFKERGIPATEDWKMLFASVDKACFEIWGRGLVEEIEIDISADKELIGRFFADNSWFLEKVDYPIHAFRDLVETRMSLLEVFKEDPICFVAPTKFIGELAPGLAPPVIRVHPQGLRKTEISGFATHSSVCKRNIDYIVKASESSEEEKVTEEILYSYWIPQHYENKINQVKNIKAWEGIFSWFGPFYKGLLYGHRYRSMLEADVVTALNVDFCRDKLVWDPDYREAGDVSDSDDYFTFFNIDQAQCDVCSKKIDRSNSILISSLTIKQNMPFVERFYEQRSPLAVVELMLKDWSMWLVCLDEAREWGFVRS